MLEEGVALGKVAVLSVNEVVNDETGGENLASGELRERRALAATELICSRKLLDSGSAAGADVDARGGREGGCEAVDFGGSFERSNLQEDRD